MRTSFMKFALLSLVFALFSTSLAAQRPYFCIDNGARMAYASYDAKGNVTSTSVTEITGVTGGAGTWDISYTATVNDADGNAVMGPLEMTAHIDQGNVSAALGASGSMVEVTGNVPHIPSRLAVGQLLEIGSMKINSLGVTTTANILEHKVVDREEITTPAGSFKCYVIEQTTESRVMGIRVKGTTKTWYARGVGSVKSESYDTKGNLVSSQELQQFTK